MQYRRNGRWIGRKMLLGSDWRRFLKVGALITLLPMAAVACSKSDVEKAAPESSMTTLNPGPLELVFYNSAGSAASGFDDRFGDAIRKKFPNYTITYLRSEKDVNYESLFTAGVNIDMIWNSVENVFPDLEKYQLQNDMTSLIKQHNVDLGRLDPESVNFIRTMSQGKMYALPIMNSTFVIHYNKEIFDRFGFAYPKDGMTWEETIALGKRLNITRDGVTYNGISVNGFPYVGGVNPFSIPFVDTKTNKPTILDDGRWKTIYDQMVGMYQTTGNASKSRDTFLKDRTLAMFIHVNHLAPSYPEFQDVNWDMVSYPLYKEAPGVGPQPYPILFSITKQSKHPNEAMVVLAYLLSEEAQMGLSEKLYMPIVQTPAIVKALGTKTPFKGINTAAIFYHKKMAPIPQKSLYESAASAIYSRPIADIASGKTDMNTAFRQIEEEVKIKIAQEQAK